MNERCTASTKFCLRFHLMSGFWAKVDKVGECWEWTGAVQSNGYGSFGITRSRSVLAHRFAYEELRGQIPEGMALDHLCRNRLCVRPLHLEPVTTAENNRRALPFRMENGMGYCKNGHPLSGENVYGRPNSAARRCKTCNAIFNRAWRERMGATPRASRKVLATEK